MKKVRTLTYCTWTSVGSILQSYALTRTLKSCGYDTTLWLEERQRAKRKLRPRSVKDCVKWVIKTLKSRDMEQAHQKRQDFILRHMDAEYFPDYEAIARKAMENREDIYLAGSDQIWYPDKCDPLFFLDFAKGSRRISYAASMGKTQIPQDREEKLGDLLRGFERISVREKDCVDALRKVTNQDISVHIDPTFLLDTEAWRAMEKAYPVKEPYILLYMIYWNSECKNKVLELKKRTGLPVYAVCSDVSRVYADKHLYDVGVEEFLWLVDHAKYVVTSSFHGVAFSILFRKKFAAVVNPQLPSRIENILNVLSVPHVDIPELDSADSFAYDAIFWKIEKERQKSIQYLKEAIG